MAERLAARGVAAAVGREIQLVDGFYKAEGSKFKVSEAYYDHGRGLAYGAIKMITCKQHMSLLYRAFVARTQMRIVFLEQYIAPQDVRSDLTIDEKRNEPKIYRDLFSSECRIEVERCYLDALLSIRGRTFVQSDDVVNALVFLQGIVATALWKYRCDVGETLEAFARKYDRLDVSAEKRRLHLEAQGL